MNLDEQFQAAAKQVDNLPAATAAQHMHELYGLYKQATEGDHDMKREEVDANAADNPSGPAGMSQAQWESWSQYKGVPEDEAKRQYVARTAEINGAGNASTSSAIRTDAQTSAPLGGEDNDAENTTISQQPNRGPGASQGGLRGDITAGAPYGGEDKLKGAQE